MQGEVTEAKRRTLLSLQLLALQPEMCANVTTVLVVVMLMESVVILSLLSIMVIAQQDAAAPPFAELCAALEPRVGLKTNRDRDWHPFRADIAEGDTISQGKIRLASGFC